MLANATYSVLHIHTHKVALALELITLRTVQMIFWSVDQILITLGIDNILFSFIT